MTERSQRLGAVGEAAAEQHLRQLGYKIIARNLRIGRLGELDLLALDGNTLAFIEVKSRLSGEQLGGFGNIHVAKQNKLRLLAEVYLQGHAAPVGGARFDAVEVVFLNDSDPCPQVTLIKDAFR
jgi:putative endonuclease